MDDILKDNSPADAEEVTSLIYTFAQLSATWSAVEEWRAPLVSLLFAVLLAILSLVLMILPAESVLVLFVIAVAAERLMYSSPTGQNSPVEQGFVVTECLENLVKNCPLE